jgi:large subunit ribosomal protein L4
MKTPVYNKEGKEVSKVDVPEAIFGLGWNSDLVHQVITSMASNKRTPVAHTKDRSDVRGGGKKPWKQKGTGRARHGSSRSPIWRGGGVTFGPRNEKNYSKKVNKKMKTKALNTILSRKLKDNEIIFIDSMSFSAPKAKEAKNVIMALAKIEGFEKLGYKKRNAAYIATEKADVNSRKSFSNFNNVKLDEVRNLNPIDILNYKYVIIENPDASLKILESRIAVKDTTVKPKAKKVATTKKAPTKKVVKKGSSLKKVPAKKLAKKAVAKTKKK